LGVSTREVWEVYRLDSLAASGTPPSLQVASGADCSLKR